MTLFISLLAVISALGTGPFHQPEIPAGKTDTLKVWNVVADRISVDPLGQFYMINNGTLIKYDALGDSVFSWSEPQTGRITLIDSGEPMRILVYQKDFNLLRFLNNRLAPISGPIRLDDLGITVPLAISISHQGGFWVVDGSSFRLRQIDKQNETIVESRPLNLPSGAGSPDYRLTESGDQVFLLIPGLEIQVFDLFANLIKKIPLKVPSFNVYGTRILLTYPDKITLWKDPVTAEETLATSSGATFREACLLQNRLLIRTAEKVFMINR